MLKISLLDSRFQFSNYPFAEGFESTLYINSYDGLTKIFKGIVPLKFLERKERMIKIIDFADLNYMVPDVYTLYYDKNAVFIGYSLEYISGTLLDEYCNKVGIDASLLVFEEFQLLLEKLHTTTNIRLTDFKADNFIVCNNSGKLKFLDIDNLSLDGGKATDVLCSRKYRCKYSKKITIQSNIYSFYLLFLNIILHVNIVDNSKCEMLSVIENADFLQEHIKQKLKFFLKIRTKRDLNKLDYLF